VKLTAHFHPHSKFKRRGAIFHIPIRLNNAVIEKHKDDFVFIIIIIIIILIFIMALQPFVGHWPLFHFLDPIHSR
jgi:hypothetical protein